MDVYIYDVILIPLFSSHLEKRSFFLEKSRKKKRRKTIPVPSTILMGKGNFVKQLISWLKRKLGRKKLKNSISWGETKRLKNLKKGRSILM